MFKRDIIRKTSNTLYLHLVTSIQPTSVALKVASIERMEAQTSENEGHVDLLATIDGAVVPVARFQTMKAALRTQRDILDKISLSPWRWPRRMALAMAALVLFSAITSAVTTSAVDAAVQESLATPNAQPLVPQALVEAPDLFGGNADPSQQKGGVPTITPRINVPPIKAPELNCNLPK